MENSEDLVLVNALMRQALVAIERAKVGALKQL